MGIPPDATPVPRSSAARVPRGLAHRWVASQEMLDHCGRDGITPDVEVIPIQKVDEAYERMLKGDVW